MSDVAIRVEGLGKKYKIGAKQESYKALRDILSNPFRLLKNAIHDSRSTNDDTIWALKDVSFEIKRGEVVGVIGRNGAGKSTLLKILSRITEPTEGFAEIRGRVGSLLEVGTGFHPELTGRENIILNGSILGMKRAEIMKKFDEIVAFAEVDKFIDTPVKHFSSGMYLRLAFAVAAHLEPEILLVDEVLAVGDASFQKKCFGKMGDVAKKGMTVIFVSHNMTTVRRLCPQGIYLENGKLFFSGTIEKASMLYFKSLQIKMLKREPSGVQMSMAVENLSSNSDGWGYKDNICVKVSIHSQKPVHKPAIDIAFYSDNGTRLFAIESDKVMEGPEEIKGIWNVDFVVSNPGLLSPEISIDVGLRSGFGPYIEILKDAATVSPDYKSFPSHMRDDTLLCAEATVKWYADENRYYS